MVGAADLPDPRDHIYAAAMQVATNLPPMGDFPVSSSILTKVNLVIVSMLELKLHWVPIQVAEEFE
jgi:hypothetical protein